MTAIVVTGTPGTGKTTLAKQLAEKLKFKYIDANEVIKEHNLAEGRDEERDADIVDTDKLSAALLSETGNVVIDSHLSHYLPPEKVDLCVVTVCDIKELKKRLQARKYSEEKIRENLDAEIFETILNEAAEKGHNMIAVSTDESIPWKVLLKKVHTIGQEPD